MRMVLIALLIAQNTQALAVSIFNEYEYRPLIADRRAMHVGDVITVLVMETSDAKSSADLASSKQIETELSAGYNRNKYEVSFGLAGKGKSAAQTGRNGKIKASLTVEIKQVFPNNTYLVQGVQSIGINGERQSILLSGIVRAEDITPQNTVLSTRLGNAQITYTGAGTVSDSQNRNYVYKVLSFLGLV